MISQCQEEGHGLTALDRIHQVRQVSPYLAMEVTVTLAASVLMGRWEQGQNGCGDQVWRHERRETDGNDYLWSLFHYLRCLTGKGIENLGLLF